LISANISSTPIERKTAWQLSEAAGDPNSDGVQYFLDRAVWSADALRDAVRSYAAEHHGIREISTYRTLV
jgi:SRSO17 transposase